MPTSPHPSASLVHDELTFAIETVRQAGELAFDFFRRGDAAVYDKRDGTIVTQADLDANTLICEALRRRFPTDAILSEESPDDPVRLRNPRCWIVDPIDGTSHFAAGQTNWAVLLALCVETHPVLGVVFRPALGDFLAGADGAVVREHDGRLSEWQPNSPPGPPLRLALGANVEDVVELATDDSRVELTRTRHGLMGALTLFDEGVQAFAANTGGASEWDIAAVDAVIRALGGRVSDLAGAARIYNQPDVRVRGGLAAAITPTAHDHLMSLVRAAGF